MSKSTNYATTWGEQEGVRRIIVEKPTGIKVFFQEEEPGCGQFTTKCFEHFPERHLLDSYDEPLHVETIKEAAKCIADIVGRETKKLFLRGAHSPHGAAVEAVAAVPVHVV